MDDPVRVGRVEGVGDLPRDRERLVDGDATADDAIGQRLAVNELHHQRPGTGGFLEAIDMRDVRVIQRREHLCLALESGQAIRVGHQGVGQHLEGIVPLERQVACTPDLAHPAFAEDGDHFV